MVIKAVIFDYGGVLMRFKTICEMWNHLRIEIGLSEEEFAEKAPLMWKLMENSTDLMEGRTTAEEYEETTLLEYVKLIYGVERTEPLRAIQQILHPIENVTFNSCMLKLPPLLRSKGMMTGLLTNNFFLDRKRWQIFHSPVFYKHYYRELQTSPIDRSYFNVVVESCVEGITKPNPKIYAITQSRILDVDPDIKTSEVLFLDDSELNCEAARQFGWKVIKVTNGQAEDAVSQVHQLLLNENGLDLEPRSCA